MVSFVTLVALGVVATDEAVGAVEGADAVDGASWLEHATATSPLNNAMITRQRLVDGLLPGAAWR